ncbi:hypothetical protein BJ875DRAFT_529210 [Amylocarpus encephaloides]|uniref:F-box domain-containing protein n=1 Tax=Amylocarpus encephaloides TaxID=45428 RepID=A0A9P7YLM9_9HELO|nr:hypothetical protein BJ875DRAFT_529210 [Amylocarpus encephaloides]
MSQIPSLGALPPELKLQILKTTPDPITLQSLVLTSSAFHQAYTESRKNVLNAVLLNELTPHVIHDAIYAVKASSISKENADQWKQDVTSFLIEYKNTSAASHEISDLKTLIDIARLHRSVRRLALSFYEHCLDHHPITNQPLQTNWDGVSRNEKRRLFRTCYRYQIYCVVLGDEKFNSRSASVAEFGEWAGLFFGKVQLWELCEFYCLRDFIFGLLENIFSRGNYTFLELESRAEDQAEEPQMDTSTDHGRLFSTSRYYGRDTARENLMTHGVEYLPPVSNTDRTGSQNGFIIENRQQSVEFPISFDIMSRELNVYFENGSNRMPYTIDRRSGSCPAYPPFDNDHRPDRPNYAWGLSWKANDRSHSRAFGLRQAYLRSWGYVMWDKERLEALDVLDLLENQYVRHGPKKREGGSFSGAHFLNETRLAPSHDGDSLL